MFFPILMLFLSACTNKSMPSEENVKELFDNSRDVFERINISIREDIGINKILKIDVENQNDTHLDNKRFNYYLKQLDAVKIARVSLYQNEVEFIVSANGMVFGGCLTTIENLPSGRPCSGTMNLAT